MSQTPEDRLRSLGIELPVAAAPAANYVPYVITGNLLFISGQGPAGPNGFEYTGKVGDTRSVEDGIAAARLVAINILAQAKAATGDLRRIARCVKLGAFVNCTPDFSDQPKIINGASDLMVEVLGDAGPHARFAVGAPNLPFDMTVEIDAVFEITTD
jgi:enamine deaminase RidA (YjgF/YER057c/UK114 family)